MFWGHKHHGQSNLLSRVNDKDGANGESNALADGVKIVLGDHVVQPSNLSLGIGNDGELEVGLCNLVDVADPFLVVSEVVGALQVDCQRRLLPGLFTRISHTKPIILTFLASNSSLSLAKAPSSVVQTGVKSAG